MSVTALIGVLHDAGIHPTGLEIAEMLWLSQHLAPPAAAVTEARPQYAEGDHAAAESAPAPTPPPAGPVPLSTPRAAGGGPWIRGHQVGVPDIPGLHQRQDIQRALRPLRRTGPSRRRHVIDEDATATFIANTGLQTAITRPAPERWFDVVLAVDSSPSMDLWRPMISDLQAVLRGTGAFRDVRLWRLRPERRPVVLPPNPGAAPRSPRELIDGSGRRLFLVVTDGAARGWHEGSATGVLADWSKTGPVAVLQPLPEPMWPRTGLATVSVSLSAHTPGTPNNQLRVDYRRRHHTPGIPVPVLGVEPDALRSWAHLAAGSASGVRLAATLANGSPPPALPAPDSRNEPGTAMERFRASASPHAYQLAVCLSAVPLMTLPVMRLIQHAAVPTSNPSALAEVILGGLISRTGDSTYEFPPGIREVLLGELRRSETALVFSAISDYIAQHADGGNQTFSAVAGSADGPVTADAEAFSWVHPMVAARLGLPLSPLNQQNQVPVQAIGDDTGGRAPARAAYLALVRDISPGGPQGLMGRDAELAELASFCLASDAGSYLWWQGAAWAGKTALMSWFVLHPPSGVTVVSFFVTARLAGQNTREAFAESLIQQLADLTGQGLPAILTEATRESYLRELLAQAAADSHSAGHRLVLVVDGLDEDESVAAGSHAHSIASLLPASPPAGMRVIVASRPHPSLPADVPGDHPLRSPGIIRVLAPSAHAEDLQRLAKQDLRRILNGSLAEQEVLGFLTASYGGLSAHDLADLGGSTLWEIEATLHAFAGRSITSRPSRNVQAHSPEIYLLAHEELLAAALDYLGDDHLASIRQQLVGWADTYREMAWPPDTPEYLLIGYSRLLAELGDVVRMLALVLDAGRRDRMRQFLGTDEATLDEIITVAQSLRAHGNVDPTGVEELAAILDSIERRNASDLANLPVAWAVLGETSRALRLANALVEPGLRAAALAQVAMALARAGQHEQARSVIAQAETVVRSITDPSQRAIAQDSVAQAAQEIGADVRAAALDEAPALDQRASTLVCPSCGIGVQAEDLICFRCGANLPRAPYPDDVLPGAGARGHISRVILRISFPTGNIDVPAGTSVILGRDPDQSLVAAAFGQYENVSRRHATVMVDDSGRASIRDEGSTGGTFVNGERVLPGSEVRLLDGDQIRLAADVTGDVSLPTGEPDPALDQKSNPQWRQ